MTEPVTPIVLRPYQQAAVQAVYDHLRQRDDSNEDMDGHYWPVAITMSVKPNSFQCGLVIQAEPKRVQRSRVCKAEPNALKRIGTWTANTAAYARGNSHENRQTFFHLSDFFLRNTFDGGYSRTGSEKRTAQIVATDGYANRPHNAIRAIGASALLFLVDLVLAAVFFLLLLDMVMLL